MSQPSEDKQPNTLQRQSIFVTPPLLSSNPLSKFRNGFVIKPNALINILLLPKVYPADELLFVSVEFAKVFSRRMPPEGARTRFQIDNPMKSFVDGMKINMEVSQRMQF